MQLRRHTKKRKKGEEKCKLHHQGILRAVKTALCWDGISQNTIVGIVRFQLPITSTKLDPSSSQGLLISTVRKNLDDDQASDARVVAAEKMEAP